MRSEELSKEALNYNQKGMMYIHVEGKDDSDGAGATYRTILSGDTELAFIWMCHEISNIAITVGMPFKELRKQLKQVYKYEQMKGTENDATD